MVHLRMPMRKGWGERFIVGDHPSSLFGEAILGLIAPGALKDSGFVSCSAS
jgi:hypothetical protein